MHCELAYMYNAIKASLEKFNKMFKAKIIYDLKGINHYSN